jgi:hypothetical protein
VWWGLATHQRATRRGIRAPSPHHLSLQRSLVLMVLVMLVLMLMVMW